MHNGRERATTRSDARRISRRRFLEMAAGAAGGLISGCLPEPAVALLRGRPD